MTNSCVDCAVLPSVWQETVDAWPSALVARKKIDLFSGGLISARRMANLDCDPSVDTPAKIVLNGKSIAYDKHELAFFLAARTEVVPARTNSQA